MSISLLLLGTPFVNRLGSLMFLSYFVVTCCHRRRLLGEPLSAQPPWNEMKRKVLAESTTWADSKFTVTAPLQCKPKCPSFICSVCLYISFMCFVLFYLRYTLIHKWGTYLGMLSSQTRTRLSLCMRWFTPDILFTQKNFKRCFVNNWGHGL